MKETILKNKKYFPVRKWQTDFGPPIFIVPLDALLIMILGKDLTYDDMMTILKLDSISTNYDSRYTLSIRNKTECIVLQRLNQDKSVGRYCATLYESGLLSIREGSEYKKQLKKDGLD